MANPSNFSLLVTLARPLCPCTARTAARNTGTLAHGAATIAVRFTAEGRYVLRVECTTCGRAFEEDWATTLRLAIAGPPPGASFLALAATQPPGKA